MKVRKGELGADKKAKIRKIENREFQGWAEMSGSDDGAVIASRL